MLDEYITKINDETEKNENEINKKNAIIRELNLLNFEDRVGRISLLGVLFYLPILFGLFYLGIPSAYFPGATLFTSFGLGFIGNLLVEKKYKCKKRFKNISKSKNESERLEEILRLEMEIEKLNLHNEIIKMVNDKHNNETNMIKMMSKNKRFSIHMNKSNYTKEELAYKINELESSLKTKYDFLNKLSNISTLKNKKNFLSDKMSPLFYSMMCAFVPLALSIMPIFACIMVRPLPVPSMIPLYTTIGPAALAFIGSMTYYSLRNKNTTKAIESISKDFDSENDNNLLFKINNLKSEITNIIYLINTYRNEFENYDTIHECKSTNRTKIMEFLNDDELTLDSAPKLTLK